MATPSDTPDNGNDGGDVLSRQLFELLISLGYGMPESSLRVRDTEKSLSSQQIELPESLRDPLRFLRLEIRSSPRLSNAAPDIDSAISHLSRAAREGRKISAETERQMKEDRKRAEDSRDKDTK